MHPQICLIGTLICLRWTFFFSCRQFWVKPNNSMIHWNRWLSFWTKQKSATVCNYISLPPPPQKNSFTLRTWTKIADHMASQHFKVFDFLSCLAFSFSRSQHTHTHTLFLYPAVLPGRSVESQKAFVFLIIFVLTCALISFWCSGPSCCWSIPFSSNEISHFKWLMEHEYLPTVCAVVYQLCLCPLTLTSTYFT